VAIISNNDLESGFSKKKKAGKINTPKIKINVAQNIFVAFK